MRRYGLRPSSGARCILLLAGKRCLAYTGDACDCPGCLDLGSNALDHGEVFISRGKAAFIVAHPYNIDAETMGRLATLVKRLGLDMWIDGESWYSPGHAVRLVIATPRHPRPG